MPASPFSRLPTDEQRALLEDLNYLNVAEIRAFCSRHSIPYKIAILAEDGRETAIREEDRKGVVLDRIRHFLRTGKSLPGTRFPAHVVRFTVPLEKVALTPDDRLFYGQYHKSNHAMLALLRDQTAGKFRDGAIARILARDFWSRGKAPTYKEYAAAWLKAVKEHRGPHVEWAFLSDRARKEAGPDWKKMRTEKARSVIKKLNSLVWNAK